MRAVKANKSYRITDEQKMRYQQEGFDIIGDDGNVITYGNGKSIPHEQYEAVKAELAATKAELAVAQAELADARSMAGYTKDGAAENGDMPSPEKETRKINKK